MRAINEGAFGILSTGSADITFTVKGAVDDFYIPASNFTIGGASATGNITFNVDDFASSIVASTGSTIQTSGKVIFSPYTALTTIGVSGGTGDYNISEDLLSYVHSDVSGIQIGRNDGTGDIEVAAHDWGGQSLELLSNSASISFTGDQTNLGNLTLDTNAGFTVDNMLSGAGDFLITVGGLLTLNDQIVTTSGTQNGLVVSTEDDFINNVGSNVFSAANSRWLLYSSDPANNTRGGLLPDASDFGKTYASDAPNTIDSGNRFIYSTSNVPTLTFQVVDDAITYGESLSESSVYVSGLLAGDTLNNIGQTGEATYLTNYSSAGTTAIVATQGGLFNALGYAYNFLDGQATIKKAILEVALENTSHSRLRYTSESNYGLTFSGFKLGDDASVIDVSPKAFSNADFSSPAGLYSIFLNGGVDDSYEFSFSNLAGSLEVKDVELPKSVEKIAVSIENKGLSGVKSKINETKVANVDFDVDYKEFRKDERKENKTIKIMGGLVEISPEVAEMLGIKENSLFYQQVK